MDNRRRVQVPATAGGGSAPSGPRLVVKEGLSLAERQRQTAEYLSEMVLELRNLARSVQLYNVMVPLEYAYYEAFGVANRVEVPPAEIERIKALARAGEELDRHPANPGTV